MRLPRGSSPTARTRGAAGSVLPVPPALVREADANERTDAGTGTRTGTATGNNGAFDDAEKSEDPHGYGDGARP